MSLEKNKESNESKLHSLWRKTYKYFAVGGICLLIGLAFAVEMTKNISKINHDLRKENRELKKAIENTPAETVLVPYTVLVPVTESIQTTKETAPVTDAPVTKTQAPETKTTVPVTETETVKEISEDEVRALTNPLTKEAAAPFQVKVSNVWKVYWINVSRSDLYGMKPDDFKFFDDYINEHFEADACEFYVVVTDVPDLCFQFTVTKSEYVRSTCEAFAGITKTDSSQHYPYCGTGSCAIRYNDPEQFEMQALTKDKYGIEQYDDSKIYHFSEFGDDMFAQLDELQRNAR